MPQSEHLRLLTLNLWGSHHWHERRHAVVAWVNELQPDLVAFQEVVRTPRECHATWIAERTEMSAVFAAARADDNFEFGNAVLSRLPIIDTRTLLLTDGGSGGERRCAVTVDVESRQGCVSFTSTHLAHLFNQGWIRVQQVQELADFVGEATDGFPHLLCGDFNARPESDEVRFVKGMHSIGNTSFQMFDAFEVARPGALGFTWDNRNPYAAASHIPAGRIDYIFVGVRTATGAGSVVSAEIVCDAPRAGAWPTDHVGLMADLWCPALETTSGAATN